MFKYLLEDTEKIIYELSYLLQEKPILSLKNLTEYFCTNTRSIKRHLTIWLDKKQNSHYLPITIQQQSCYLKDYYFQATPLALFLYQENETFQILIYLLDSPYCSIEELKQVFFCSRSTIKRKINKVKSFLHFFELQVSFQTNPILTGPEFNLRFLAFATNLVNDPPFDFRSKEELFYRIKIIQENRVLAGCSFNHLPSSQLITKDKQITYRFSERGWLYFWRELLKKDNAEIAKQLTCHLSMFSEKELMKWINSLTQISPYTPPLSVVSKKDRKNTGKIT